MNWSPPISGHLIRHAYPWRREARLGRVEGTKDRPCAVVLAFRDAAGSARVIVAPVTHRTPDDPSEAVEIPAVTKRRLGLDEAQSRIILSEVNEFTWPGPDVRPGPDVTPAMGALPPRLFEAVRGPFVRLAREGRVEARPPRRASTRQLRVIRPSVRGAAGPRAVRWSATTSSSSGPSS